MSSYYLLLKYLDGAPLNRSPIRIFVAFVSLSSLTIGPLYKINSSSPFAYDVHQCSESGRSEKSCKYIDCDPKSLSGRL